MADTKDTNTQTTTETTNDKTTLTQVVGNALKKAGDSLTTTRSWWYFFKMKSPFEK